MKPSPHDAHIERLISEMTVEEKAGQLNQEPSSVNVDLDRVRKGLVGSMICANSAYAGNDRQTRVRAAALNALQRVAVQESRLGIPLLFARDVIHGHRAVAPIPLGQAASWSPDLVRQMAAAAAMEAKSDGLHWTFTPMLDIARDPRWGRVAEGFGEDPYLGATLAEAAVEGYQSAGLGSPKGIAACAKHYVGYGSAEGGRDYNTGEITPTTLENVYLPPFHGAVRSDVATVMAAFLDFDGTPATCNGYLLNEILRHRWGWNGVVVSDWGAVGELIEHGVAKDPAHAAELAVLAGVDIDMASHCFVDHLPQLVLDGRVPMEVVDVAVRRVLRLKAACGLFDDPYSPEAEVAESDFQKNRELARTLAHRAIVLLQNQDDLLPLPKSGLKIGVCGPLSDPNAKGTFFGTWTLDGMAEDMVDFVSSFRETAGENKVRHALLVDEAVSMARTCDVVVAVIGESNTRSGEDNCVMSIDLPPGQIELLEALSNVCPKVVAVVSAGRPLALGPVLRRANAVLLAFHLGVEAGPALADVLFGHAEPGGRLPVSLPRCTGQIPIHYNHKRTGRPRPFQGSRYQDGPDTPQFPFGFGLSYSTFEYSDLEVEANATGLKCLVRVSNSGNRDAEEVVQVYLTDEVASQTRPVKELKAFERIGLKAGESKTVSFDLQTEDLGFFDRHGSLIVEPGWFIIQIGPNSQTGLTTRFELKG